ncbi:XisI protein [Lyngbya sp. PCC 8106]|uniref:XisI protein n=1 Tax=Lyngbya sp. (strain PCC 8106) TaxID=313612 RepID=UPI0000EAA01C|nr:XisI protein [Lyngbya sp. PCC 8106]EAW34607.1 XisI protein-like protein [Lyngbya sp. PCC 8106]
MDKLERYRQCICKFLAEQSVGENNEPDMECQLIFDGEHVRVASPLENHYQLLDIGWQGLKRVYNCFIHLDIKDNKIWIQRNLTEVNIAQELVNRGIPPEDIVLGLHPPYKRPYTGYGVPSATVLSHSSQRSV